MAIGVFYTVFRQTRALLIRGMPQVETLATLALGEGLVGIIHRVRGHNMSFIRALCSHCSCAGLRHSAIRRPCCPSNPPFSYVGPIGMLVSQADFLDGLEHSVLSALSLIRSGGPLLLWLLVPGSVWTSFIPWHGAIIRRTVT